MNQCFGWDTADINTGPPYIAFDCSMRATRQPAFASVTANVFQPCQNQ